MGPEAHLPFNVEYLERQLLRVAPFPQVLSPVELADGVALQQLEACRRCKDRRCAHILSQPLLLEITPSLCHLGIGVIGVPLLGRNVVFNGVFSESEYAKLSRIEKKRHRDRAVASQAIDGWCQRVAEGRKFLIAGLKERIDDSLGAFHDVQTAVSSLSRAAEEFVDAQPGLNTHLKIEGLPTHSLRLVKSVQLLQARMALLPLLTNPEAARYGQRHPVPIYKVVDKLVRIMQPMAERQGVHVSLSGPSSLAPTAYASFETLPLVLLDNAIKYSARGQKVEVRVVDMPKGVHVEVESYGPAVSPDEKSKVFERGFRAEAAQKTTTNGQGLGLYLASIVASAHGIQINYVTKGPIVSVGGIPCCNHVFEFSVW